MDQYWFYKNFTLYFIKVKPVMHPKCQQFRGNPWAGVRGHPVGVARVHHLTEDHEFDVIKDNCLVGLGFGLMIQSGS